MEPSPCDEYWNDFPTQIQYSKAAVFITIIPGFSHIIITIDRRENMITFSNIDLSSLMLNKICTTEKEIKLIRDTLIDYNYWLNVDEYVAFDWGAEKMLQNT